MKTSSYKDALDRFIYAPVYDHLLNSRRVSETKILEVQCTGGDSCEIN